MYNSVFEGAVKISENCWIMRVPPSVLNFCIIASPLTSAHGWLNWSDKVRTGERICCE